MVDKSKRFEADIEKAEARVALFSEHLETSKVETEAAREALMATDLDPKALKNLMSKLNGALGEQTVCSNILAAAMCKRDLAVVELARYKESEAAEAAQKAREVVLKNRLELDFALKDKRVLLNNGKGKSPEDEFDKKLLAIEQKITSLKSAGITAERKHRRAVHAWRLMQGELGVVTKVKGEMVAELA